MRELNPYTRPESEIVQAKPPVSAPRSFFHAVYRGAWIGVKWTTYVAGPLAALMLILDIGLSGFAFFSGKYDEFSRAWDFRALFAPFGFYLSSCLWGAIIGGVVYPSVYYAQRWRSNDGFRRSVFSRRGRS